MSGVSAGTTIPLPSAGALPSSRGDVHGAAALVAAFAGATADLSVEEAARLAAVRPETIRKWRRRPPRWVKADTVRRIAAHLAGEPSAPASRVDEGFRRAFRPWLRESPPE